MTDPILRELLCLWPAWATLVGHVSRSEPRAACPQSIYGSLLAADQDRLVALLYAHQHADTMDDARVLYGDLLVMARLGVRPRCGNELLGGAPS